MYLVYMLETKHLAVLCGYALSIKHSGDICSLPLHSLLLDELSMDKRDSDGFLS